MHLTTTQALRYVAQLYWKMFGFQKISHDGYYQGRRIEKTFCIPNGAKWREEVPI